MPKRFWVSFLFFISAHLGFCEEVLSSKKPDNPKPGVALVSSSLQLVNKGANLLAQGKSLDAETVLGEAVIANPDSPEAMYNFGLALSFNGKFNEAVHAFLKAIDLKYAFPEAHLAIGNVYLTVGDKDQALKAFDTALGLASDTPTRLSALHNRGLALMKLGKMSDAKACFFQVLGENPEDSPAAFQLGQVLLTEKRFAEALIPLETARKDFPVETEFSRGKALKALARDQEAKEALALSEKALEKANISDDLKTGIRQELAKFRQANGL